MNGCGLTGQFANLPCKYKHEIPMSVLLPTGGPVRPTISGTDVDGVREVDGIVAAYECKALGANTPSRGQLKAMRSIGNFFIGSRWLYKPIGDPPRTAEELFALKHGCKQYAVPVNAVIWGKSSAEQQWLYRYLTDCGFYSTQGQTSGYAIQFNQPEEKINTHIFVPTEQWKAIAYIADYYAKFKSGKYQHHETNFIDSSLF